MFIQNSFNGLAAWRNYNTHQSKIATCMQRLASGSRINSAADDPGNFARVQSMRAQLKQLEKSETNVMDLISMGEVMEGVQNEKQSILHEMQGLATQAATGTLSDSDRDMLNKQYQQLKEAYYDMNNTLNDYLKDTSVSFFGKLEGSNNKNSVNLESTIEMKKIEISGNNLDVFLDGLDKHLENISLAAKDLTTEQLKENGMPSDASSLRESILDYVKDNADKLLNTQMDPEKDTGITYTLTIEGDNLSVRMQANDGKDVRGFHDTDISSQESAREAMDMIKEENSALSTQRANTGAMLNRLEHTLKNIQTMQINLTDSISRIADTDMAKEMMELVKEQVLLQTSTFCMAQFNQQSEMVLKLLQ